MRIHNPSSLSYWLWFNCLGVCWYSCAPWDSSGRLILTTKAITYTVSLQLGKWLTPFTGVVSDVFRLDFHQAFIDCLFISFTLGPVEVHKKISSQQQNGFDCGVYVLAYGKLITERFLEHQERIAACAERGQEKDAPTNEDLDTALTIGLITISAQTVTQYRESIKKIMTDLTEDVH